MALRIRRDDQVVVISGKDRGRTGTVISVVPLPMMSDGVRISGSIGRDNGRGR